MNKRKFYERYFSEYPDLVNLRQFRTMMGGLGEVQARRLMQEDRVKHFLIRGEYLIPKKCVIDYVLSRHYAKYRVILKSSIPMPR